VTPVTWFESKTGEVGVTTTVVTAAYTIVRPTIDEASRTAGRNLFICLS
jgi:hypothetical protein